MNKKSSQDDILTLNPVVGLSMDDVVAAGREAIRQSRRLQICWRCSRQECRPWRQADE